METKREGKILKIYEKNQNVATIYLASDTKLYTNLPPVLAEKLRKAGKNPEEYGTLTDEKNKAYFLPISLLPEIEEGIKVAKAEKEEKMKSRLQTLDELAEKGLLKRVVSIPEYRQCDVLKINYCKTISENGDFTFESDVPEVNLNRKAVECWSVGKTPIGIIGSCNRLYEIKSKTELENLLLRSDREDALKQEREKQYEEEYRADIEQKEKTGYCFNCGSWCYGACGNYRNKATWQD